MQRPTRKRENELQAEGFKMIAGVDEAGRGPLAGPVVAAAVILPPDLSFPGLADSKLLNRKQREGLFALIRKSARAIGVGIVSHELIDKFGIGQADVLAMRWAVDGLGCAPDCLLIDGLRVRLGLNIHQEHIIKGDRKCVAIAAASIIAKVSRDRIMARYHKKYPAYGFDRHNGYGTAEHLEKLKEYGCCPIHRRSFARVRDLGEQLSLSSGRPAEGRGGRS